MSPYQIEFTNLVKYDPGKSGITVPIILRSGPVIMPVETKLDSGSSYCVFQRILGEELGFDIECGHPQPIGTATGSFMTYGHEITLSIQEFDFDILAYFAKDYSFQRNVLGRYGFLNRIVSGLNDYKGHLYWRPIDEEGE